MLAALLRVALKMQRPLSSGLLSMQAMCASNKPPRQTKVTGQNVDWFIKKYIDPKAKKGARNNEFKEPRPEGSARTFEQDAAHKEQRAPPPFKKRAGNAKGFRKGNERNYKDKRENYGKRPSRDIEEGHRENRQFKGKYKNNNYSRKMQSAPSGQRSKWSQDKGKRREQRDDSDVPLQRGPKKFDKGGQRFRNKTERSSIPRERLNKAKEQPTNKSFDQTAERMDENEWREAEEELLVDRPEKKQQQPTANNLTLEEDTHNKPYKVRQATKKSRKHESKPFKPSSKGLVEDAEEPRLPKKDRKAVAKTSSKAPLTKQKPPESTPLAIEPTKAELRQKIPEVLLDALASEEYKKKATPQTLVKVLRSLAYHTQSRPFIKKHPQIAESLRFLSAPERMKELDNEHVSVLVSLLVTNMVQDQEIWASVVSEILRRHEELDLSILSFILLSMKNANSFLSVLMNNDGLFYDLEEDIITKLDQEKFDPATLAKIVKAYALTENGTEDFYRLIERKIMDNLDKMDKGSLSSILSHLSTTQNCNDELFKDCKEAVINVIEQNKYKPNELSKIARAYNSRKMIDEEFLKKLEKSFLTKHEFFQVSDVAALYSVFLQNRQIYNPKKAWAYLNQCVDSLYGTLEVKPAADLFQDWNNPDCQLRPEVKDKVKKRVLDLIQAREKISKEALVKIYNIAKEEQVEPGKYNVFAEKVFAQIKDYI